MESEPNFSRTSSLKSGGLCGVILLGAIYGFIVGGNYTVKFDPTLATGDGDTQAFGMFFGGLPWAVVGAIVFAGMSFFYRALTETNEGEASGWLQRGPALAAVVVFIALLVIVAAEGGSPSFARTDPGPVPPGMPKIVTTPSYVGTNTYPGMRTMQDDPQGSVAETRDSYAAVTSYFASKFGGAGACTTVGEDAPCSRYTTTTPAGTPLAIEVHAVIKQDYGSDDDSAPTAAPTTGPTVIYYLHSQ